MSSHYMAYHCEPHIPVDINHKEDFQLTDNSQPVFHGKDTFENYVKTMLKVKEIVKEVGIENIEKSQA